MVLDSFPAPGPSRNLLQLFEKPSISPSVLRWIKACPNSSPWSYFLPITLDMSAVVSPPVNPSVLGLYLWFMEVPVSHLLPTCGQCSCFFIILGFFHATSPYFYFFKLFFHATPRDIWKLLCPQHSLKFFFPFFIMIKYNWSCIDTTAGADILIYGFRRPHSLPSKGNFSHGWYINEADDL